MGTTASPVSNLDAKNWSDVTVGFVTEKPFDFFKASYVFIDCVDLLNLIPKDWEKVVLSTRHQFNLAKLMKAPGAFLKAVNELRHSTVHVIEACATWNRSGLNLEKEEASRWRIYGKLYGLTRKANNCVAPIWEMCDFFSKTILFISKDSIKPLKGINGIALALGKACDGAEAWLKAESYEQLYESAKNDYFIKFTKAVSYFALGVFTALAVFFGYVFSPVLFTVFSASTVACTIIDYYRENLGKAVKKRDCCQLQTV